MVNDDYRGGGDIIALLITLIAEGFVSVNTLNILARTSKSLQVATSDPRLVPMVLHKTPAMTKGALRKLFVLTQTVSLRFMTLPCPYRGLRILPRCDVHRAFQVAMVTHQGTRGMANAFHVRKRRSDAMRLVWKKKKKDALVAWQQRRRDIEQIHEDLFIVPSAAIVKSEAEMHYAAFGTIKRMSGVYRDKRSMAIYNAGLLNVSGVENTFMRVARLDMNAPDTLSKSERLYVLRHNIAWEHYLLNFTNFIELLAAVERLITDINHIEFLFPLPVRWPWILPASVATAASYDADAILPLFQTFRDTHNVLYT